MERILKSTSNQIWQNTANKIIKDRPFSETVIQDGLTFWGSGDINFQNIVSGQIKESYDIRTIPSKLGIEMGGDGSGLKFTQSTIINRPTLENNYIKISGTQWYLIKNLEKK